MADQNITTSIDDLVKYLSEHGETESSDLAKALGVNESIIETWADVLEKAKITKVSYKVGKMFVSLATEAKGGVEVAKKTAEIKRGITESELKAQTAAINQVSARIDGFKRYVAGAETTFKSRAGEIKDTLGEIDRLDSQVGAAAKRLKDKKDYVDGMAETLGKSMEAIEQKSGALAGVGSAGDASALADDIRDKLDDADAMIKGFAKEFEKAAEENRKSFAELVDGMKKESGALRRALFRHEKEMGEYESMAKAYGRDVEQVKRRVSGEKGRLLDEIAKTTYEVGKAYLAADGKILALRKSLADLKGQFGGFAELSDKIAGAKADIAAIEKQRDDALAEVNELSTQLRALAALSADAAPAETEKVVRKVSASGKRVSGLGSKADAIKKGIDDIGR